MMSQERQAVEHAIERKLVTMLESKPEPVDSIGIDDVVIDDPLVAEFALARIQRSMTRVQAAVEMGVGHNSVYRWERGETRPSPVHRRLIQRFVDETPTVVR
jgi:DNA-binding XRE family transcriptional regulator